MRAAIYARVSSAAQREAHTIENQLRILPAFVASQGWDLVGTFVDDGRSAKSGMLGDREGFAELVRAAEAKKFDLLVVVDVDRLTRTNSIEERALILGPFQRLGIDIVTPSGGRLDMRTMLGELWVTIQALGAAEENRKRAERIKAGKLRAIAEGRKPAGVTPFGWTYTRATGSWAINEPAAELVREIFRRVAAGDACQTIADDFMRRGVLVPKSEWTQPGVYRMVRSRAAVGEWSADKKRAAVVCVPALITEDAWQAAQRALLAHRRRGLRKTKHTYLLEGLAVCGACGDPIAIRSACGGPKKNQPAYVCRGRKRDRTCDAMIAKTPEVDADVWDALCDELNQPELAEAMVRAAVRRTGDARDWATDIEGYQAHLVRLGRVESAIMARFRRGAISEGALDTELEALNRERKLVRDQLATAERAISSTASAASSLRAISSWLTTMRASLPHATPEQRRALLVELVPPRSVVIVRGRAVLDLRLPLPASEELRVGIGAASIALVNPAGYRTHSEANVEILRIRRVA